MDSLLGGGWPRRRVSVEVAHRLGRRCGEHDVEKLQGPARDLADLKDGLLGQLWAVAGTKGRGNGGGRETSKKGERYGGRRRRSSSRGISIRCRDPPSAVASLHSRTPSHPSHRSMDAVPALGLAGNDQLRCLLSAGTGPWALGGGKECVLSLGEVASGAWWWGERRWGWLQPPGSLAGTVGIKRISALT